MSIVDGKPVNYAIFEACMSQRKDVPIDVFISFKNKLEHQGYFERNYLYYISLSSVLVAALGLSVYLLIVSDSIIVQLFNAVLLGVVMVQIGMLGHDLSHNQVFNSRPLNNIFATLLWGVGVGLSESKWYVNHNQHHKEVNHSEHDPDLEIPFIFQDEQVAFKQQHYVSLRKYQHILFFIVLPVVYPIYILRSVVHNLQTLDTNAYFELLLMLLHYVLFFGLVFKYLPLYSGLMFVFVLSIVCGYYMAFVFAPNHKGMEMVAEGETVKWWHQVVCTRNLYPHWFVFHISGGLNFQIEHHLFPNMPRGNYPRVAPLVEEFCKQHQLPYYQTSWFESVAEIYRSLKVMGAKLSTR